MVAVCGMVGSIVRNLRLQGKLGVAMSSVSKPVV